MNSVLSVAPSNSVEPSTLFRESVEALSRFAQEEGFELAPYASPLLEKFTKLPAATAATIAVTLADYVDTLNTLKDQREHLSHNLNSVWLQLRKMNLRASSDLFSQLVPQDVVEIYALDGLQLFRSFHFFRVCSVDLETLFCTPWFELYERDAAHDAAYMDVFNRLIGGKVSGTEAMSIPIHDVRERLGRGLLTRANPRIVSAVRDPAGRTLAYVHVFQIERID